MAGGGESLGCHTTHELRADTEPSGDTPRAPTEDAGQAATQESSAPAIALDCRLTTPGKKCSGYTHACALSVAGPGQDVSLPRRGVQTCDDGRWSPCIPVDELRDGIACGPCQGSCWLAGNLLLDVANRPELAAFEAVAGGGIALTGADAGAGASAAYRKRLTSSARFNCLWEELMVHAELPAGSRIELRACKSDSADPLEPCADFVLLATLTGTDADCQSWQECADGYCGTDRRCHEVSAQARADVVGALYGGAADSYEPGQCEVRDLLGLEARVCCDPQRRVWVNRAPVVGLLPTLWAPANEPWALWIEAELVPSPDTGATPTLRWWEVSSRCYYE